MHVELLSLLNHEIILCPTNMFWDIILVYYYIANVWLKLNKHWMLDVTALKHGLVSLGLASSGCAHTSLTEYVLSVIWWWLYLLFSNVYVWDVTGLHSRTHVIFSLLTPFGSNYCTAQSFPFIATLVMLSCICPATVLNKPSYIFTS